MRTRGDSPDTVDRGQRDTSGGGLWGLAVDSGAVRLWARLEWGLVTPEPLKEDSCTHRICIPQRLSYNCNCKP